MRQNFAERENAKGPLAVWTTGLWQRENMLLRWVERRLVNFAENFVGGQRQDPLVERCIKKSTHIDER
jgi:phosphatidylglycerophosphatase GEP4